MRRKTSKKQRFRSEVEGSAFTLRTDQYEYPGHEGSFGVKRLVSEQNAGEKCFMVWNPELVERSTNVI